MAALDGIDTGYEPRYDFASPGKPRTPYLLASVPRTGSTYLSHELWRTGCLGAPLEYLNFEATGPNGAASDSLPAQQRIWREAVARRTSPNGVFGIKCFPGQLISLQHRNLPLLAELFRFLLPPDGPQRVVWLGRRDRTAHAISYARAALSGIWRWEQETKGRPEPAFSATELEQARRLLDREEAHWERMFADLRLTPLRLWYEDVVAGPATAAARVAAELGVALDPAAEVPVPPIHRQARAGAQAWTAAAAAGHGDAT